MTQRQYSHSIAVLRDRIKVLEREASTIPGLVHHAGPLNYLASCIDELIFETKLVITLDSIPEPTLTA